MILRFFDFYAAKLVGPIFHVDQLITRVETVHHNSSNLDHIYFFKSELALVRTANRIKHINFNCSHLSFEKTNYPLASRIRRYNLTIN
jgi:hypothetical protein